MKRRILPFILATVLVLLSAPFAASAATAEEPTVYANLSFDNLEANTTYVPDNKSVATISWGTVTVVPRSGSDNCIKCENSSATDQKTEFTIMPDYGEALLGSKHTTEELVISWDMLVSGYADKDFVILSARTYDESASGWKWGSDITIGVPDESGYGTVISTTSDDQTSGFGTVSEEHGKVKYGEWTSFAIVWKPDSAEVQDKVDLYINGQLAVKDHILLGYKIRQLCIGNFSKNSTSGQYWMKDNLRIYSGNKICSDAELGLVTSEIKGVQTSNASANAFNLRVISTVDSTACAKAGFDIQAKYTDGTEKTVSGTKEITEVYTSITANDDAGIATYTAGDLGGNYLAALTINGIPTNVGKVEITVSAWTQAEDGVKYVTSVVLITYDTNANTPITVTVVPNSIPVNPAAQ